MLRIPVIVLFSCIIAVGIRPAEQKHHATYIKYPEKLPGAFTGGFGEDTCHSCHFDYPLNHTEGSLTITGIPKRYQQGKVYEISISLDREDLGQAGFQLSSRFEDGQQAGLFQLNSEKLRFTKIDTAIQYIQHSLKGSKDLASSSASWKVKWVAPKSDSEKVLFNIAANAANGDASSFGDYIYTWEIEIVGTTK